MGAVCMLNTFANSSRTQADYSKWMLSFFTHFFYLYIARDLLLILGTQKERNWKHWSGTSHWKMFFFLTHLFLYISRDPLLMQGRQKESDWKLWSGTSHWKMFSLNIRQEKMFRSCRVCPSEYRRDRQLPLLGPVAVGSLRSSTFCKGFMT